MKGHGKTSEKIEIMIREEVKRVQKDNIDYMYDNKGLEKLKEKA